MAGVCDVAWGLQDRFDCQAFTEVCSPFIVSLFQNCKIGLIVDEHSRECVLYRLLLIVSFCHLDRFTLSTCLQLYNTPFSQWNIDSRCFQHCFLRFSALLLYLKEIWEVSSLDVPLPYLTSSHPYESKVVGKWWIPIFLLPSLKE